MKRTIACLISQEVLPNVLFIKEFMTSDSKYIFFSTKEMEEKFVSNNIINSLNLNLKSVKIVLIDADSVIKIQDKLKSIVLDKSQTYFVNVTGGNKLMSILITKHFVAENTIIYYSPINSKCNQQLHPEYNEIEKKLINTLTLDEYLRSYGFQILTKGEFSEIENLEKFYNYVLSFNNPGEVPEISNSSKPHVKITNKEFYTGGWFEEFLCKKLQKEFNLASSQIAFNVKLKNVLNNSLVSNDQELDILFIYNNDLYVVECKVYLGGNIKTEKVSGPMFKLAATTGKLGLSIKKYVAILGDFTNDKKANERIEDLAKNLNISKTLTLKNFKSGDYIKFFKQQQTPTNTEISAEKLNSLISKFSNT